MRLKKIFNILSFIFIIFLLLFTFTCSMDNLENSSKDNLINEEKSVDKNRNFTNKDDYSKKQDIEIILDVPLIEQENGHFCIPASIQMILQYYYKASPTQTFIYNQFHNHPPKWAEISNILNIYEIDSHIKVAGDDQYYEIMDEIAESRPLIAVEHYNEYIAHVTVIVGYRIYTDNNNIIHRMVYINDPLKNEMKEVDYADGLIARIIITKPTGKRLKRGFNHLKADYYDETHLLESSYLLTKNFQQPISFHLEDFGGSYPYENLKIIDKLTDGINYSVKWRGDLVAPISGYYTLYLENVDDGAQLFFDEELFIEKGWNYPNPDIKPANDTIYLEKGKHRITINFEQRVQYATGLKISWKGPIHSKEVIPLLDKYAETLQEK